MSHTPGPWIARNQPRTIGHDWVDSKERRNIAVCSEITGISEDGRYYLQVGTEEKAANTRLIAAAPDLLAALKALLPEGWGDDDTMDHIPGVKQARAAIAKAEGTAP